MNLFYPVFDQAWETFCPEREDGQHCECWYDGEICCACGDGEELEDERTEDIECIRKGSEEL